MSNSLMIYLNKRMEEGKVKKHGLEAGPVITISREVGCNGLKLARILATRLNAYNLSSDWRVLSKEVFYESARELNMHPERVMKTFKQADKYTFEEIIKAFNDKNYKSERRIVKTVADVILSFATDGFCIIVGRAGHLIARDIKNSLHIRLVAPHEYRIKNIMDNNQLNRVEALAFIQRVEKERLAFRKTFMGDAVVEELFDISLNRAMFTDEEMVDLIEYAVNTKKILNTYKPKFDLFGG